MEDVDELSSFMSFKAVAQAYCLHKHIVNEYHYEQHVCGAKLMQSALGKKERGADCAFPAAIRSAPAGHALRNVSVPVISQFWSCCC